jgi:hypothetical protein
VSKSSAGAGGRGKFIGTKVGATATATAGTTTAAAARDGLTPYAAERLVKVTCQLSARLIKLSSNSSTSPTDTAVNTSATKNTLATSLLIAEALLTLFQFFDTLLRYAANLLIRCCAVCKSRKKRHCRMVHAMQES